MSTLVCRVIKPIRPGDELLVWYGNEYALELGLELPGPKQRRKKGKSTSLFDSTGEVLTNQATDITANVISSTELGKEHTTTATPEIIKGTVVL